MHWDGLSTSPFGPPGPLPALCGIRPWSLIIIIIIIIIIFIIIIIIIIIIINFSVHTYSQNYIVSQRLKRHPVGFKDDVGIGAHDRNNKFG